MSREDWKVDLDPVFGCWTWQGRADKRDGRALVWRGSKPAQAQRVVYEAEVGPVPDGLELDHGCRRPSCVAPHHAEPVTRSENEKRKSWKYRAKRTRCPRGHAMSTNRIVTPEGGAVCRACNHEAQGATR